MSGKLIWKIYRYLLLFCTIFLVLLWLVQIVFLEEVYRMIKMSQVIKTSKIIATEVSRNQGSILDDTLLKRSDMSVQIFTVTEKLELKAQYGDNVEKQKNYFIIPSLYEEAVKNNGMYKIEFPIGSEQALQIGKGKGAGNGMRQVLHIGVAEIIKTEQQTYFIVISSPISPVDATVDTLKAQFYFIIACMILLALGLSYIVAKRIIRPIEKITEKARQLATGDTTVVFEANEYAEMSELSGTLNYATQEIGKAGKLRNKLLANVSHDLRTPLTLISGYAELIRDVPAECTPENIQIIIDESNRLAALVQDVIEVSKLQAGVQIIKQAPLNITETLLKVHERITKLTKIEDVEIKISTTDELLVLSDADRLEQVLYNLILNAVYHVGENRLVQITEEKKAGKVRISVRNDGEIIPATEIHQIWERYYRATHNHNRNELGSGLGLAIIESILKQHPNVEYGVISTVEEGTVFWFEMPLI